MIVGENDRFFLSFLFSFFSSRTYFRYGNGKNHRFVCHAIKRNTTDQYERGTSLSLLIQQFLPSPIIPPPSAPPHLASNPLYLPISRRNGRINSFSLLLPRRIIFIQRGCSVLHDIRRSIFSNLIARQIIFNRSFTFLPPRPSFLNNSLFHWNNNIK